MKGPRPLDEFLQKVRRIAMFLELGVPMAGPRSPLPMAIDKNARMTSLRSSRRWTCGHPTATCAANRPRSASTGLMRAQPTRRRTPSLAALRAT
ncbi:hypothetical protein HaLaN_32152 [Haematococcus lacustris]|uniref:Uncharacterized protein n=1 Tax=Haematococcus lacustris TaxID=44745 RepID=A0A6A0AKP4_HAELA|nr:hypothetical protein HaLaN_32152 [Haematococcus lacustris]